MRSWLIELRKSKNCTQQDIADAVGVTRQMIGAIENGEATPSVVTAQAIGKKLNFPWTRFFDEKV